VQLVRVTTHDLIDAESREGAPTVRRKDRRRGWLAIGLLVDQFFEDVSGIGPDWTDPPFVAFSMQAHAWRLGAEVQVLHPEIGDFLDPRSGVVEHEQERPIAERKSSFRGKLTEEFRDLVPVEETGFGRRHAFDGNRGDLLCDREAFGYTTREKFEERLQDRAAVIARAPVIVTRDLKMLQEPQDAIERERVERDLRQTTGYIGRDEGEEQP
jgi:hypothetical protein